MVSRFSNAQMHAYWQGHGFEEIVLIDAKDYDDAEQAGDYVDSTRFSPQRRLEFTAALLAAVDRAARFALGGTSTALIVKQLKGAGVHATGAKSHNLYAQHTLQNEDVVNALRRRALAPQAWQLVRDNFSRAGGGPAARVAVTESELEGVKLTALPMREFALGETKVPSTEFGVVVAAVGKQDPQFIVANADGNEASGMANVNAALQIRHPTSDALYHQAPAGQVYEPLSEDACAGLAAAQALFGARSLWLSYESFAVNGLPIFQTVTQAMAELRRQTPSVIAMFTAGALEQGRNGWTHQRPEVEAYFAALMRNGNVFPLYPVDANMIQIAYQWALQSFNKGIAIFASKSPLPIRTSFAQAERALADGAVAIHESSMTAVRRVVLAAAGDMVLLPVFEAKELLEAAGIGVRIVAVVNPRRLYRPDDTGWRACAEPDAGFLGDAAFDALFDGDALIAISGGAAATLEPVLLRSRAKQRDLLAWRRGETTASPQEIMAYNGLTGVAISERVRALLDRA